MRIETATSLNEFHSKIATLSQTGIWLFRGQAEASWDLVPSLYRDFDKLVPPFDETDSEWVARMERDIYRSFEQGLRAQGLASDRWHIVALAQHYGTPTRLLDWTRRASVGAFFALATEGPTDAAVWCFNVKAYPFPTFLGRIAKTYGHRVAVLNEISAQHRPSFFQEVSVPFVPRPPGSTSKPLIADPLAERKQGFLVVLDPDRTDKRMAAQDGLFTMYYSFHDYDLVWNFTHHFSQSENDTGQNLLCKIVIPSASRRRFLDDLKSFENLDWNHVYPDLHGLGLSLTSLRATTLTFYQADRL
ncbi:MAG: hypothetical protein QOK37_20 [Thermoanaerobaculia bacterium]|nr:hypothetical protein [Thermoanaerobaculia bacterium]